MNRRLYRSVADRRIGGVAAGTAAYFDLDPSIARVLWVLLALFTGGTFVIVYLVMWAVVPEEPWNPPQAGSGSPSDVPPGTPPVPPPGWSKTMEGKASSGPGPHVIFGAILIFIGVWLLAQQFVPWLNFGTLWPIGLVVIGVLILLAAFRTRS